MMTNLVTLTQFVWRVLSKIAINAMEIKINAQLVLQTKFSRVMQPVRMHATPVLLTLTECVKHVKLITAKFAILIEVNAILAMMTKSSKMILTAKTPVMLNSGKAQITFVKSVLLVNVRNVMRLSEPVKNAWTLMSLKITRARSARTAKDLIMVPAKPAMSQNARTAKLIKPNALNALITNSFKVMLNAWPRARLGSEAILLCAKRARLQTAINASQTLIRARRAETTKFYREITYARIRVI